MQGLSSAPQINLLHVTTNIVLHSVASESSTFHGCAVSRTIDFKKPIF